MVAIKSLRNLSQCRFLLSFPLSSEGGAMVLGKLPVPGRPIIWIILGQRPIARAVGAGAVVLTFFFSRLSFSFLSPSLGDGLI